jgi:hypothetical protein
MGKQGRNEGSTHGRRRCEKRGINERIFPGRRRWRQELPAVEVHEEKAAARIHGNLGGDEGSTRGRRRREKLCIGEWRFSGRRRGWRELPAAVITTGR